MYMCVAKYLDLISVGSYNAEKVDFSVDDGASASEEYMPEETVR